MSEHQTKYHMLVFLEHELLKPSVMPTSDTSITYVYFPQYRNSGTEIVNNQSPHNWQYIHAQHNQS